MTLSTGLPAAIKSRRSVRSFRPDEISPAIIQALLRAAVLAPTAMHVEPWQFVIVQDRAALKRYSDIAKTTLIAAASIYADLHDPVLGPRDGGFLKSLQSPDFNVFYDANTLIVICARVTNPFITADCWLAAENLMLAAVDMNLGTCCIGSALPALNSVTVKAELGMPFDVSAVAAIVVGVASATPAPTSRKAPVILTWLKAPDQDSDRTS